MAAGALINKRGQVSGGLILLAENVVLVLVERLAVAASERDGNHNREEEARRLLRMTCCK